MTSLVGVEVSLEPGAFIDCLSENIGQIQGAVSIFHSTDMMESPLNLLDIPRRMTSSPPIEPIEAEILSIIARIQAVRS
jgi:hypothetical protein